MKFLIELDDKITNLDEPVQIKQVNNGIVEAEFGMYIQELLAILNESIEVDITKIETPVLPQNCIKFCWHDKAQKGADIYISVDAQQRDITMYNTGTEIKFEKVGFPKLIFKYSMKNNVFRFTSIVAVKDDLVTNQSIVYNFPYSHVSNDGAVCMGNNVLPHIKSIAQLATMHNLFFASPFSTDYGAKSKKNVGVIELFRILENKPFPNEWLMPFEKIKNGEEVQADFQTFFNLKL